VTRCTASLMALLLAVTLAGEPLRAAPPALLPADSESAFTGWLVGIGISPPQLQRQLPRLVQRVEVLYTDGAYLAGAALAGSLRRAAGAAGLPPGVELDNLLFLEAGSLAGLGALPTARKLLLQLLERTPPSAFRGPALRKLVDITLASGQFEQGLKPLVAMKLADSERDELTFLQARALLQLGHPRQARRALQAVRPRSRFYAASRYLLAVLALEDGNQEQAEDALCRIVNQPGRGAFTYMLSKNTPELLDQAWLALARLRHDNGQWQRALATYQQLEKDSPDFRRARYEQAWTYFRLGWHQRCLAALDEADLDERDQPGWPDAMLLRGYALLGLCRFDEARQVFDKLQSLLGDQSGAGSEDGDMLTQVVVARALEATPIQAAARQLGRNWRRLLQQAAWLSARVRRLGSGMPSRPYFLPAARLAAEFTGCQARARGLRRRLGLLLALGDDSLRGELRALARQLDDVENRARSQLDVLAGTAWGMLSTSDNAAPALTPAANRYLKREMAELERLAAALVALHRPLQQLLEQVMAHQRKRAASRLQAWRKLTAIGKVDTVLGRKQALEIEVENLAQGRYPLSIFSQLAARGQIDDTQEYWPYDAEGWPDEFEGY